MPWVKVKPGYTYGADRRYQAGDVLEVTADAVRDFGDKFFVVPAPLHTEQAAPALPVTAATVATEAPAPTKRGRRATTKG
jgi:hypothetical protein